MLLDGEPNEGETDIPSVNPHSSQHFWPFLRPFVSHSQFVAIGRYFGLFPLRSAIRRRVVRHWDYRDSRESEFLFISDKSMYPLLHLGTSRIFIGSSNKLLLQCFGGNCNCARTFHNLIQDKDFAKRD